MTDVENLVMPSGKSVVSHTVPVGDEALRQSLRANMVPGATHVVTIRGGDVIKKGDVVRVGNTSLTVLAAYDPFEKPGVKLPDAGSFSDILDPIDRKAAEDDAIRMRAQAKQDLVKQKGRWLKLLVAMPV